MCRNKDPTSHTGVNRTQQHQSDIQAFHRQRRRRRQQPPGLTLVSTPKITTMKNCIALIALLALFGSFAAAFAPSNRHSRMVSSTSALGVVPMDVPSVQIQQPVSLQQQQSALKDGIQNYMVSNVEDSSTLTLSLKDRPPPPTAEELAAKKRNFNLWFWGGGFVAPFLATFYYFGFKFWEK